jgi:serine/threonine-protein kinase
MYLERRRTLPAPIAPAANEARAATPAVSAASVAVLPFTNLSSEPDNEYFSDGITEELITALGKVGGMRVAARSSSFAFKGKNADFREVAEKLNVATVLEGSVRKAGQRLRVSVQLVKAADGYQLWSDTYDGKLEDVFAVQDQIARAITGALQVRLAGAQGAPVVGRPTQSLEAYNLYLQGRSFWNQRTASSLATAARYLKRATEIDPNYAEAHAALAEAYVLFGPYGVTAPSEAYSQAKAAANRALALDSLLAPARAALAHVRWRYDHDFTAADSLFRQVIELDPDYPTGHQWYSEYLSMVGGHAEALAENDRATSLDPLSRTIASSRCNLLYRMRRYDDAILQCRKALELDPDFAATHVYLGRIYLKKGMTREALAELESSVRLGGPALGFGGLGLLAHGYIVSGDRNRGLELIRELTDLAGHQYIAPCQFAWAYAALGDKDQAFAWLARAAAGRDAALPNILTPDPLWDRLSSDPRFAALRTRVGLN